MKNVLITGGSRGIGEACVKKFSEKGFRVFFLYKSSDEKAERLAHSTGAVPIKCNVSDREAVRNAAEKIKEICSIDIVVNNAGISQIKMFCDISEKDWDDMFGVNVKGIYNVSQEFLPGMVSRKKGRIINISSMWGETGASCEVHYSASKAAVIGFTKALAKELGPSGITVNCVTPGVIDTEMNGELTDEDKKELCDEIPLERMGTASEVADIIYYLASERAGYITGAVVPVNGGIVI